LLCFYGQYRFSEQLFPGWEQAPLLSAQRTALVSRRKTTPQERYNLPMARGWESKSVEAQQDEAAARSTSEKPHLTQEEANRLRERETLRLALQSVVEQLARSLEPRRRAMLEQALGDLQGKLQALGASDGTAQPLDR
jgi:hypothetical protein